MFTREDIRDLLDSGRPGEEIADIQMKHMHTAFSDHLVVQEILRRRTAAYEAYTPTGERQTAEQIISEEIARALNPAYRAGGGPPR
ncbi:hypothetical protein [Nonomuraea rubra]|uniref:hypothetical protein n=1 Tax=Nonomuraea rubra TaxID=46180 RepID=UPI0033ECF8CE